MNELLDVTCDVGGRTFSSTSFEILNKKEFYSKPLLIFTSQMAMSKLKTMKIKSKTKGQITYFWLTACIFTVLLLFLLFSEGNIFDVIPQLRSAMEHPTYVVACSAFLKLHQNKWYCWRKRLQRQIKTAKSQIIKAIHRSENRTP
jgi:hypothetical protein